MTSRRSWKGWEALTCVLLVSGCSASPERGTPGGAGVSGLRLSPDPAFAAARIAVTFTEPSMRPEHYRFEWLRNGHAIPEAQSEILPPSLFAKGDRIEVLVSRQGSEGGEVMKAEVRVANTPPSLSRVAVYPSGSSGHAELRATADGIDPDRDSLTYIYRWFRNDVLVEGADGASVSAGDFTVGDRVVVEVIAGDGESRSPSVRSEAFQLGNHPPQFTSVPVAPRPNDGAFRYQASAMDPDGDLLRYELINPPIGMVIDPKGAVTWTLPSGERRHGEFPVTIRAIDATGDEATQQFTIRLDPVAGKR